MRTTLKEYLPPILLQTCEYPLLCGAEQPEMDAIAASADEVLDDQFVLTASERGIARYERIFGIAPAVADTVEDRRVRVLSRLNEQLPYTVRVLRRQLDAMCGAAGYVLEIRHAQYEVRIALIECSLSMLRTVEAFLERVLPANLIWTVRIILHRDAGAQAYLATIGTRCRAYVGQAVLPREISAQAYLATVGTQHKYFGDEVIV